MGPVSTGKCGAQLLKKCSTEQYPGLINVDSCSLHVVHGAFRSGESKSKWEIDTLLKSLHNFFFQLKGKITPI